MPFMGFDPKARPTQVPILRPQLLRKPLSLGGDGPPPPLPRKWRRARKNWYTPNLNVAPDTGTCSHGCTCIQITCPLLTWWAPPRSFSHLNVLLLHPDLGGVLSGLVKQGRGGRHPVQGSPSLAWERGSPVHTGFSLPSAPLPANTSKVNPSTGKSSSGCQG